MSDEQIPDFGSIDDIVNHAMNEAENESASEPTPQPESPAGAEPTPETETPVSSESGSPEPETGADDAIDPERARKAIEIAENMAEVWQQIEERAQSLSQRERELQEAQLLRQLAVTDPERFLALVGAKKQADAKEEQKADALGEDWFSGTGEQEQKEGQTQLTPETVQQLLDARLGEYQRAQQAQQAVATKMQEMANKVEEYIASIPELGWNKDVYAERAGAMFVKAVQNGVVKLPTVQDAMQMTPQQLEEAYAKAERAAMTIAAQLAEQETQKLRKYLEEQVQSQAKANQKASATAKAAADFVPGQHVRNADKVPETVDDLIRMGEQIFRQFEQES